MNLQIALAFILLSPVLSLYSPLETLLRSGPVPFISRLNSPTSYVEKVSEYQRINKGVTTKTAQGNVDAFLASPDVWVEQKSLEKQGKREVYDYGKGEAERGAKRTATAGAKRQQKHCTAFPYN